MNLLELIGTDRILPADFNPQSHGLVFDNTIHAALLAVQATDARHRIAPVELTDGTWASSADVLTEATDGVFEPIFSQLPTELAEQVAVVAWEEVINLLPVPTPIDFP
jgi:hypothetical protein